MQLGAGGGYPVKAAKLIFAESGMSGMYAGLSAAISRQAVYTTLRVGLYDWIRVRRVQETALAWCTRSASLRVIHGNVNTTRIMYTGNVFLHQGTP